MYIAPTCKISIYNGCMCVGKRDFVCLHQEIEFRFLKCMDFWNWNWWLNGSKLAQICLFVLLTFTFISIVALFFKHDWRYLMVKMLLATNFQDYNLSIYFSKKQDGKPGCSLEVHAKKTRNHFGRMRATRLPTILASCQWVRDDCGAVYSEVQWTSLNRSPMMSSR